MSDDNHIELARIIVEDVLKELHSRSGLENAWDEIDSSTKNEILNKLRIRAERRLQVPCGQADAWSSVVNALNEVLPGWHNLRNTGLKSAVEAIKSFGRQREHSAKFAFDAGLEIGKVLGKFSEERKFVDSVINAIGMISVAEAQAAIAKYREENK